MDDTAQMTSPVNEVFDAQFSCFAISGVQQELSKEKKTKLEVEKGSEIQLPRR
jgi:hypothetical protein